MTSPNARTDTAPIDEFSECHAGIVSRLQELDRLPPLLEPAMEARRIAGEAVRFFRNAVFEHHDDEERELFPTVLASAKPGEERNQVQAIVDRLVREHRHLEAAWSQLEPELNAVAMGGPADVDVAAMAQLVTNYQAHAKYEEDTFLPLSKRILGRSGENMAALGERIHMRHRPLVQTPF